jgi:hypothetical protein
MGLSVGGVTAWFGFGQNGLNFLNGTRMQSRPLMNLGICSGSLYASIFTIVQVH